jgi:hypothetical protein
MRYAILNESKVVLSLVEADEPPPGAVKAHDETAAVGRRFNGWTFEEVRDDS